MITSTIPGIGIYIRKSSNKQGELSLPAQEHICRKVIVEPSGLPVYRVYKDILSGRRPDRTDYQEMLADARSGKLRMVVFHKVNRFGRDAAEGLTAIQELRKLGIEIRIADLPTLDLRKPEGMLIFTFLLGQGQYEVENLGSEARKGMEEKVRRGGWPFRAPEGYRNCREEIAPRKFRSWVAVDRYRAAIVRLIYTWYAPGKMTLRAIVTRLNRLHEVRIALGKRGCLRRSGKPWTVSQVWEILTNRFYRGELVVPTWGYCGAGTHTLIIHPFIWERVQQVLIVHGQVITARHSYLLQGRLSTTDGQIVCCTTAQRPHGVYRYYYRETFEGRRQYYAVEAIDQVVLERVRAVVLALGEAPAAIFCQRVRAELERRKQGGSERRVQIAEERQRLLDLAKRGRFTDAEIAGALLKLDGDLADVERVQAEITRLEVIHAADMEGVLAGISALAQWAALDTAAHQEVIGRFVQRVDISVTGEVARLVWQPLWDLIAHPSADIV